MAHVQREADEGQQRRYQAQHEAQADIGGQAGDIGPPPSRPALGTAGAEARDDARVPADRALDAVEHEPVLDPAGQQAAGEQQHAGEGGEQHRGPQQGQRMQHMLGLLGAHQGRAEGGTAGPMYSALI
eukprot:Opistho-2@84173